MKNSYSILVLVQFLCFSLNSNLSIGGDTISLNESLSIGQTIISSGGKFELGFFRPGDSIYYYIGIWYKNIYPQMVVWVANRDKPLGTGAKLIIIQSNLVLLDNRQNSVWSALAGNIDRNISVTAVLHDDGNLILSDMSNTSAPLLLWQSFDYPTHTFLPGAKLGYDKRTHRKQVLISWRNLNDPAPGPYSLEMDPKHAQFVMKWNRTKEYWASGSWNGQRFSSVPASQDTNITVGDASQCRSACFNNCSCSAYTYDGSNTCSIWTGDLFNLQELSKSETGRTIFVKRGSPEAQTKAKRSMKLKAILSSITALIFLLIGSFSYILYRRRMAKRADIRKGTKRAQISHWNKVKEEAKVLMNENSEVIDVPYFHLEIILEATDNFSNANKLGQGGFGPVYKGIFPGEKEIAVKRLSSHSGQGMDEFKNEVTLIAKLQHRNLVRLLGYCINSTEQILLYEYMPNKSLDTFIFAGKLCQLLDWKRRYDIIMGIARGLAYLHHDSRLRIIHRDLKTSNILLDEEMNPKISDFGLARIVEGKGTEANTNKVVGTYGYMSPEYALDGLFSIKSDVFSFGVVVLEIISGRRNTGFYQSEEASNLLGYAWKLWTEEAEIQLIEKSSLESCNRSEAIKCINVALLCVQEDPNDRPNMSNVILMLGGEGISLPQPNRPAFVIRKHSSNESSSSSNKQYIVSNNQVTITVEEGR